MADRGGAVGLLSEAMVQAALSRVDAGIYLIDVAGDVVAVNELGQQLLGYPAGEMLGQRAHDLIHAVDDVGDILMPEDCELIAVARTGHARSRLDDVFVRKDGSYLRVGWTSAAVLDGEGRPAGAIVVFHPAASATTLGSDASTKPLSRAEERAGANAGGGRTTLLAGVTSALTSTLDVREALRRLAGMVVPRLADWCVIHLLTPPDQVDRVAVVHRDRNLTPPGKYERPMPALPPESASSLVRALHGGAPVLMTDFPDPATADGRMHAEQLRLFSELSATSAIVVPLVARRHVVGALTLVRTDPSPPYTTADVTLADDLARRAGLAVDNARLYTEQRATAEGLQRSLLPSLPNPDHLQIRGRYLPARDTAEIGGDWYDAFVLPDGVAALVVGDVVGHDLEATIRMSQLRNMLRALAWDRTDPPSEVMRRLDAVSEGYRVAPTATAVLARLEGPEGGPWQLRWANAGHPPPLLVTDDGEGRFLEAAPGHLLGLDAALPRVDAVEPLPAASTLLLYTDGLVERRAQGLDEGLERLRRVAAQASTASLDQFCEHVLDRLAVDLEDDVALLAVRLPHVGEGSDGTAA